MDKLYVCILLIMTSSCVFHDKQSVDFLQPEMYSEWTGT